MKKLLIASAALAISTSFAFANQLYRPYIPVSVDVYAKNYSNIHTSVSHVSYSHVDIDNNVYQKAGIFIYNYGSPLGGPFGQ